MSPTQRVADGSASENPSGWRAITDRSCSGLRFRSRQGPVDISDAELRRATEAYCGLLDACFVPRLPVDYCIRDYVDLLTYEAPDCRLEAVEYFDCVATLYCDELEYDAYVGLPSCPVYANAFDRCLELSVRR